MRGADNTGYDRDYTEMKQLSHSKSSNPTAEKGSHQQTTERYLLLSGQSMLFCSHSILLFSKVQGDFAVNCTSSIHTMWCMSCSLCTSLCFVLVSVACGEFLYINYIISTKSVKLLCTKNIFDDIHVYIVKLYQRPCFSVIHACRHFTTVILSTFTLATGYTCIS